VNTQRPLILADAQQDERFHSLAGTDWVRSWLGVPLLSKEQVIGLITINAREADLYAEGMAELALALGRQAAIAIENARLYEETKRRADEMTVLYHTSLEIGVPTDLPDLLWTLCDRAAGLLGVDKGGLYLYDEAREELELVVSYKLEQDFTGTRLKLGEGVAGRVHPSGGRSRSLGSPPSLRKPSSEHSPPTTSGCWGSLLNRPQWSSRAPGSTKRPDAAWRNSSRCTPLTSPSLRR
jgi:signal transduction protein with GAF and PtsI domain